MLQKGIISGVNQLKNLVKQKRKIPPKIPDSGEGFFSKSWTNIFHKRRKQACKEKKDDTAREQKKVRSKKRGEKKLIRQGDPQYLGGES